MMRRGTYRWAVIGLIALSGCSSVNTVWVHRYLEWPGLLHEQDGTPIVLEGEEDPLVKTHAELERAGIRIYDECGVELPVCAALGCPARSLELYIEIARPRVADSQRLGFREAEDGPPAEEDGFNPCEPL